MIKIITPKSIPYFLILMRTKKFYSLKRMTNVVISKSNMYYIFIHRGNIQIEVAGKIDKVKQEIQNYLNLVFKGSYIGIHEKDFEILNLQGVKKFKI